MAGRLDRVTERRGTSGVDLSTQNRAMQEELYPKASFEDHVDHFLQKPRTSDRT